VSNVNLNALTRDLGTVEFNGVEHAVLPIKGTGVSALRAVERGDETDPLEYFRIAHACVPSLTWDQVLTLDAVQVGAIIAIATGQIAKVEALLPKATPAGETAAAASSPSA
jgi:hypothetical protein